MRNCNEVFKSIAVKTVSEAMKPEKLMKEKGDRAENRRDFGNDDYKSIVLRNMGKEKK